jgi:hypothetical protein
VTGIMIRPVLGQSYCEQLIQSGPERHTEIKEDDRFTPIPLPPLRRDGLTEEELAERNHHTAAKR